MTPALATAAIRPVRVSRSYPFTELLLGDRSAAEIEHFRMREEGREGDMRSGRELPK